MSAYNNYQRDARGNNNRADWEERRPANTHISVAKHASGKENAFSLFLKEKGRSIFKQIHGERYDNNNPEHTSKMSNLFRGEKEDYRIKAKALNEDRSAVLRRKRDKNSRRRQERSALGIDFVRMQREHQESIRNYRSFNPTSLPLQNKSYTVVEDQIAHMRGNRQRAETAMISVLSCRTATTGNPLVIPAYTLQVISIAPLVHAFRCATRAIHSYPAEIGVTTFHLQTGVRETKSIFVHFDKHWFNAENNEQEEDECRVFNSENFGIDFDGPTPGNIIGEDVFDPCEAFHWLQQQIDSCPAKRLLCDAEQLGFVMFGVKCLADYTGANARRYFQEKIMKNLVSIQDYTCVLLKLAPLDIPRTETWREDAVKQRFLFHHLVPSLDHGHICEHHESIASAIKYRCVRSHNARLLHNFYYILKENKVQDVYDHFSEPIHCPCLVDMSDDTLPTTVNAPSITRAEFEEHALRAPQRPISPEEELIENTSVTEFSSDDDDYDDFDEGDPYGGWNHVVPGPGQSSSSQSALPPSYSSLSHRTEPPMYTPHQTNSQSHPEKCSGSSGPYTSSTGLVMSQSHYTPTVRGHNDRDVSEIVAPPALLPAPVDSAEATAQREQGSYKQFTVDLKNNEWATPKVAFIHNTSDSEWYTRRNGPPKKYVGCMLTCNKN